MKRMICIMLAVLLLLPVFATTAFAHGHGGHGGHGHGGNRYCEPKQVCKDDRDHGDKCRFVDENGDKICDNCNNQCADCGKIKDDNADGFCDKCGNCPHYADENKDGICDHHANCKNNRNAANKPRQGKGGHHGGRGRHCQ